MTEPSGSRYTTVMKVWRKTNRDGSPVCSPGWWSRSSCEFLLVGVLASAKGSILGRKTTNCEPQEFASVRGAHSAKPHEITQAVADFLDVEKRLELFCRDPHPQFDSWGLEVPDFFQEARGTARAAPVRLPKKLPKATRAHEAFSHLRMRAAPSSIEPPPAPSKPAKRPPPYLPPPSAPIAVPEPPAKRFASQDAVWAALGEIQPIAGKRKTVHRAGCGCFLCRRARTLGDPDPGEEVRGPGAPVTASEVRFHHAHDCV